MATHKTPAYLPIVRHISAEPGQHTLVNAQQLIDRTLANLQRRQMRQKIIADEEAHEDEIVNHALEIPLEG